MSISNLLNPSNTAPSTSPGGSNPPPQGPPPPAPGGSHHQVDGSTGNNNQEGSSTGNQGSSAQSIPLTDWSQFADNIRIRVEELQQERLVYDAANPGHTSSDKVMLSSIGITKNTPEFLLIKHFARTYTGNDLRVSTFCKYINTNNGVNAAVIYTWAPTYRENRPAIGSSILDAIAKH